MGRNGTIAWYRNPSRASQDSLGVTYEDGTEIKIVRPDFIFFSELPDGTIVADIVDPHGIHLSDALTKLKGLARYAEAKKTSTCGKWQHSVLRFRISLLLKSSNRLRVKI